VPLRNIIFLLHIKKYEGTSADTYSYRCTLINPMTRKVRLINGMQHTSLRAILSIYEQISNGANQQYLYQLGRLSFRVRSLFRDPSITEEAPAIVESLTHVKLLMQYKVYTDIRASIPAYRSWCSSYDPCFLAVCLGSWGWLRGNRFEPHPLTSRSLISDFPLLGSTLRKISQE
jgi:hypothetical protein